MCVCVWNFGMHESHWACMHLCPTNPHIQVAAINDVSEGEASSTATKQTKTNIIHKKKMLWSQQMLINQTVTHACADADYPQSCGRCYEVKCKASEMRDGFGRCMQQLPNPSNPLAVHYMPLQSSQQKILQLACVMGCFLMGDTHKLKAKQMHDPVPKHSACSSLLQIIDSPTFAPVDFAAYFCVCCTATQTCYLMRLFCRGLLG